VSSPPEKVVIVGGGPAGATAARVLATAGVPVQILDRAPFPRNKPCGGGISVRALSRFGYLSRALQTITTHYLSRLHLEGPGGRSTVVTSDGPAALMIRRVEFDAMLLGMAREAGADVVAPADIVHASEAGRTVTLTTRDGRRFTAGTVIAADGVHSVVARRLGINPGWPAGAVALDMMEETPREFLRDVDPTTLWVAYGYEPRGARPDAAPVPAERARANGRGQSAEGYAYIFPKRDHVNNGIGYVLSHFRAQVDRAPYDLQREFVAHLRDRGIVEGESMRSHFTPFIIPVGGPLAHPGRGRVLLAGDAGGFVNAFTAEGIYYAMVSGDLAARAVLEARAAGSTAMQRCYRRLLDHEIGTELRDSVRIQRYLFADRRRISRIVDGARRDPRTTRLILDFAMGRRSYREVRRRILAGAPRLALQFLWEHIARRR
jgi:flavin-dependent dehydrogenase